MYVRASVTLHYNVPCNSKFSPIFFYALSLAGLFGSSGYYTLSTTADAGRSTHLLQSNLGGETTVSGRQPLWSRKCLSPRHGLRRLVVGLLE
jgi:hypothetical protein